MKDHYPMPMDYETPTHEKYPAKGSVLKKGLINQEKITQKKPGKCKEDTQRPLPNPGKAPSDGKPGSFTYK